MMTAGSQTVVLLADIVGDMMMGCWNCCSRHFVK